MRNIDMSMLQFLKPFFYVAETGSIRRAAEQLFLAPSAVSHQICQLEKLLGYPLFERRNGHSLRLLPAGKVLYERIPMLDNELFLLRSEMRSCMTEPEKISIGVFTQYSRIVLSCLSGFTRATGRLDHVLLTESSDGDYLCRALYAGKVDYAVMLEESLREGMASLPLFESPFIYAVHKLLLWNLGSTPTARQLCKLPLIRILCYGRKPELDPLKALHYSGPPALTVDGPQSALDAVSLGIGGAVVCARAVGCYGNPDILCFRMGSLLASRKTVLAWYPRRSSPPQGIPFLNGLVRCLSSKSDPEILDAGE